MKTEILLSLMKSKFRPCPAAQSRADAGAESDADDEIFDRLLGAVPHFLLARFRADALRRLR